MRLTKSRHIALLYAIVACVLMSVLLVQISYAQAKFPPKRPSASVLGLQGAAHVPPKTVIPGRPGPKTPLVQTSPLQPYQGYQQYMSDCNTCHHYDAQGDGSYSVFTLPQPANLTAVRDTPSMAFSIIKAGLEGTAMPAHTYMSTSDINNILAYIKMQPLDTAGTYQWEYPWAAVGGKPLPMGTAKYIFTTTCAGCHGPNGDGRGMGYDDPHFWPKPANFHAHNSDVGRRYHAITYGVPGTMMAPQRPRIQPDEVRLALANYVGSFYNPSAPDVIPTGPMRVYSNPNRAFTAQNIGAGSRIFDLFCVACHGGEANGTFLAPRLSDREWRYGGGTDNAVFLVVTNGIPGKLMPGHTQFTEQERWDVITFLRFRGGHSDPRAGEDATQDLAGAGKTAYVHIKGLEFRPNSLMVEPGTTVVWINDDQTAHTTTSNSYVHGLPGQDQPYQWNSGLMNTGDRFSRVFAKPGVTRYYCEVHPAFMRAQIVVGSTD